MSPNDLIALLLTQAWQLAVLVGGVLLVNRLLAKDRPHLAHALWLVVLLKCITPPLWSSSCGVFCWLQPMQVGAAETAAIEPVDWLPQQQPAALPLVTGDVVVSMSPLPRNGELASVFATDPLPDAWSWQQWLVSAWLGGTLLWLVIALVRWCGFLWRLHRCPRRDEPALAAFTERLARRLRVGRRVRLLVSESRIGPAVIGLWRPTILLPSAIVAGKAPAELEPILAHELLHVRRGDLWLAAAQLLAQALWWFHPLVWLASRLLSREAERCCDEQVLAELRCEPARYARTLLDILQLKQQLVAVPAFPGVRPVDVTSNRLERIMRLGHGCRARTPWWCWLILLLAAALALPGAAFVVGAKEPPQDLTPPRANPTALPQPAASAAAEAPVDTSPRISRVYQVRDVLQRLREELKADEATAKDDLRGHVLGFAGLKDSQLAWDGNRLVASHTAAEHERIAAALEQLREFGVRQVVLTVRMISGPPELLEKLPVRWSAAGGALPQAGVKPPSTLSAAFDFRPLPLPAEARPGEMWTQATSVVEKNMPVLYALLDQEQTRTLVVGVQDDRKANILFAPKVTVFNGQRATVMDATQRPFVVGVKPVSTAEPKAPTAFEPQIHVVDEGTTLRMRPLLQGADRVRLDYEFTLASVKSVETAKIPQGAGNPPLVVQVPEVASVRFSSSLDLPLDKILAVGALTKQGVKPTAMIVLLEASEIDLAAEHHALRSSPIDGPIAPKPRAVAPAAYLKDDVQYFPPASEGPRAVANRLDRKIVVPSGKRPLSEAMEDIAKAAGVSLWLDSRGLAAARVTPGTTVNVPPQEAPVAAKTLLQQILGPLLLDFCVLDDAVKVSSLADFNKPYTKVYNVADLVTSEPNVVTLLENKPWSPHKPVTEPVFKPLIQWIVTTIAPTSWDGAGGTGSIAAFDTNLSLVVSQSQEVHEQIADLLIQARRLLDQQVRLDLRLLAVPERFFEQQGLDFEIVQADNDAPARHARLSPAQSASLLRAAGDRASNDLKVTLVNGQTGDFALTVGKSERQVRNRSQPRLAF